MQNPWTTEINASYHRQQLLAEAATERLAALAAPADGVLLARQTNAQRMARTLVAAIVASVSLKRIRVKAVDWKFRGYQRPGIRLGQPHGSPCK